MTKAPRKPAPRKPKAPAAPLPRPEPYNPLARASLGMSVAEALLEQTVHPLGALSRFLGAGIYALYYTGDFPLYKPMSDANTGDIKFSWPIYVGKAVPAGARKALASGDDDTALYARLSDHKKSVILANNLNIEDFWARYLVVEDIWIPLGESLLIASSRPIWNRIVEGFGNHTPGKGRFKGQRPRWDVIHPGRKWADDCAPRVEPPELIVSEVETHYLTYPPPPARLGVASVSAAALSEAEIDFGTANEGDDE